MARRTRDRRVKRHTAITSPRELGLTMQNESDSSPSLVTHDQLMVAIGRIDTLNEIVRALEDRVMKVETQVKNGGGGGGDQLANDIMAFLRKLSPLKVNTGTIASNLNSTSSLVHARLKYLVDRNGVKSAKEEGHSTVYWYESEIGESSE